MDFYISVLTKNYKLFGFLKLISFVPLKIKYDVNHISDYNCIGVICDYKSLNNLNLIESDINKPIIFFSNITDNYESYLHFINMLKFFSSKADNAFSDLYKLSDDSYFSIEKHSVITNDETYLLTNLEFRLLYCLFKNKDRPSSVEFLLDKLDLMSPSSLYVCIKKLRQKIEKDCNSPLVLVHEKNKGYYLSNIED